MDANVGRMMRLYRLGLGCLKCFARHGYAADIALDSTTHEHANQGNFCLDCNLFQISPTLYTIFTRLNRQLCTFPQPWSS